ncbi:MAG TPA: PAS domain-containing protein [Candidatus Pullichristensenella excrementipullorum]|nr:PAS domain-containing protein [Candidatus Pullichristensenella excrementipullorum]
MQNYQELMRDIEARMQTLGPRDVCALFLLSVESREAGRALDMTESAERAASLLSRFFRITDIVGYLGENRFAAFLTGNLTGSVVWEKAATLSEALWFANEQTPAESIESYVGVYVFRAYDDVFKAIFRKADYALEMAHKDANRRFYIYTMPGTEPTFFRAASGSFSPQMLRSYIDEGVREKYDIDTTAARRITDLEQELQESQEDLRKTIGELETVNEELQAANEELLTANEELQSSNEELQSVNEELYTVNTEYQQKVDELTMMTNDLSNFLSSTMIGILFVDGNLNIRKFTEYIGREFQLMEQDVGRSIQIFAHSFPYEKIVEDAQTVLKTLAPIDREVVATNGQYYTLRIAPYRTTENSIKGLVITIIDSLETDRAKKQ